MSGLFLWCGDGSLEWTGVTSFTPGNGPPNVSIGGTISVNRLDTGISGPGSYAYPGGGPPNGPFQTTVAPDGMSGSVGLEDMSGCQDQYGTPTNDRDFNDAIWTWSWSQDLPPSKPVISVATTDGNATEAPQADSVGEYTITATPMLAEDLVVTFHKQAGTASAGSDFWIQQLPLDGPSGGSSLPNNFVGPGPSMLPGFLSITLPAYSNGVKL
jgi:hypothetical protein